MISVKRDPGEQAIGWWRRPMRQLRLFFDLIRAVEGGAAGEWSRLTVSHCWSEAEPMGRVLMMPHRPICRQRIRLKAFHVGSRPRPI